MAKVKTVERQETEAERPDFLKGLDLRETKFVLAMALNGGRQAKAAIAAGYSQKSPDYQGSMMMRRPKIHKAVAAAVQMYIDTPRLLATIAGFAFDNDLADYVPWLAAYREKGLDTRRVKRVKFHDNGTIEEIELYNTQKAHDQLLGATKAAKGAGEADETAKPQHVSYNNVEKIEILLVGGTGRGYHPEYEQLCEQHGLNTKDGSGSRDSREDADQCGPGVDDGPAEDH